MVGSSWGESEVGEVEVLKLALEELGGWVSELLLAGPETWKWTGPLF